jgi:hypothetical protein
VRDLLELTGVGRMLTVVEAAGERDGRPEATGPFSVASPQA